MATTSCGRADSANCVDDSDVLVLKLIAIGAILIAGIAGVAIPLVGKDRRFLRTDGNVFFAAKAFAAGVILATGFVHMLSDATSALTDPCLPVSPWRKFPFSGFISMMASLLTLVADFVGTQFYEQKEERRRAGLLLESVRGIGGVVPVKEHDVKVNGEEEGNGIQRVGIHAHAVEPRHNHPRESNGCEGRVSEHLHGGHSHGLANDDEDGGVRHVVVSQLLDPRVLLSLMDRHQLSPSTKEFDHVFSRAMYLHETPDPATANKPHGPMCPPPQPHGSTSTIVSTTSPGFTTATRILELGIVSHSVIIGLSLGVSHSPCTIRPLIAALSFHQFFEGFALGGCISQAQFKKSSSILMACFFAITTPSGIGIGTGLASLYNNNSPRALIVEGILDSVSAGILVYMALVDLIAADFLSKRMKCNVRLQVVSYFALFLGAGLMSSLAVWS
ncbi:hypothetical protein GIB67_026412 [Kingdonia uniflora]|uniref:Uncharacterized protein n=1 Tax=Kingdonia uniflora TaxID=39325 RepID=A0A7J7P709_9MAGN|nr:hypothetical protein GIB67_026412 [Kingdonia uniflora]